MAYITTRDGTELYVKDWGVGRPVILIHGWPLSADSWDEVALPLVAAGYRTIAYDRRGFGRSSQPWNGYEYDTFADDLADVITAAGASQPALVGFSMGGGEVTRYISRYGASKVSHAALVGSVVPYLLQTPDNPEGVPEAVFTTMKEGISLDRAKFWSVFFKQFYGAGLLKHPVSDELMENSRNVAMMASLKATLACVDAFGKTDFRPDLAAITCPTLIIHGTADATVPIGPTARAAAKAIPHAILKEYAGAPHGLFATHREDLIKDLLAFLGSGG